MNIVEVKITGSVTTSLYGPLETGDLLRTNLAFAKHLVEDCRVATYVNQAPAQQAQSDDPAAKRIRARSQKSDKE